MAAWKHGDSPNNGCRFNSMEKDQGGRWIRSLKNKLVPVGGVLQGFEGEGRVKYPEGVHGNNTETCWGGRLPPREPRGSDMHPGSDSKLPQMPLAVQNR